MNDPHALIAELTELEPIKTWSLIVTLLGDLEVSNIAGKDLGVLLSVVGLKPEATRVALHRLKKDGWITSIRQGREVSYSLSEIGLSETRAAYDDVYRADLKYPDGWRVVVVNDDECPKNALRIFRNVWLVPRPDSPEINAPLWLDLGQDTLPDWFHEKLVSADTQELCHQLARCAREACDAQLTATQTAAIRLLCLHHWRKIALREATWAALWLAPESPIAQCHRDISKLFNTLPCLHPQQFHAD